MDQRRDATDVGGLNDTSNMRSSTITDDVFQKQVWCFMCPAPSCRLTEYGFADRQDADNALREHLDECHD